MKNSACAPACEARETLIEATVEPSWSVVSVIRERVAEALATYPPELRAAATVTASELVENAVKYGDHRADKGAIRFSMTLADGGLCIRTVNDCASPAGLERLNERIAEIQHSQDKEGLYLARMEALLACSAESGRLGLYRIAYEGMFELACEYQDQTVTVTATRGLR